MLLIIKTNLKSEIQIINVILYYIKIKIKFDDIIYQIIFEEKIIIKKLDLNI